MAEHKGKDAPSDKVQVLNKIWAILAVVKYIVLIICIILITVGYLLHGVYDDFTPAFSTYNKENNLQGSVVMAGGTADSRESHLDVLPKNWIGSPEKSDSRQVTTEKIYLSDLLIIYPLSTAVLIILLMEILGHLLGDPMTKFTNLFFVGLRVGLVSTVFLVSLLAFLRTFSTVIMIASALAFVFVIFEIINFTIL